MGIIRGLSVGIITEYYESENYPWIIWKLSAENYHLVYHHAEKLTYYLVYHHAEKLKGGKVGMEGLSCFSPFIIPSHLQLIHFILLL